MAGCSSPPNYLNSVKFCTKDHGFEFCGTEQAVLNKDDAKEKLKAFREERQNASYWAKYCMLISGEQVCKKI